MRRFLSLFKKPEILFWVWALIALVGSIAVAGIVYWRPEKLLLIRNTSTWYAWLSGTVAASIVLVLIGIFLFFGARTEGKRSFSKELQHSKGDDVKA